MKECPKESQTELQLAELMGSQLWELERAEKFEGRSKDWRLREWRKDLKTV